MSFLKNRKVLAYLICYTILIFLSGVFVNKFVSHRLEHHRFSHWMMYQTQQNHLFSHQSSPHKSKKFQKMPRHHIMKRFIKKLDLTEQQQTQFNQILSKHHSDIEDKQDQTYQKSKAMRKQISDEIKAILNPDQKVKYEKMKKKFDKKRHRRKHHRE